MKPLLSVTRDRAGSVRMYYLRYAEATVAKTQSITKNESIALDVNAEGEVIGVELISPDTAEIEILRNSLRSADYRWKACSARRSSAETAR